MKMMYRVLTLCLMTTVSLSALAQKDSPPSNSSQIITIINNRLNQDMYKGEAIRATPAPDNTVALSGTVKSQAELEHILSDVKAIPSVTSTKIDTSHVRIVPLSSDPHGDLIKNNAIEKALHESVLKNTHSATKISIQTVNGVTYASGTAENEQVKQQIIDTVKGVNPNFVDKIVVAGSTENELVG